MRCLFLLEMKKNLIVIAFLFVRLVFCQTNSSLAENYFYQGDYKRAATLFETLQKNNPYNTRYLKRLITCYQEMSNHREAEKILKRILAENPSQKYLHVEIGFNFDRQQKKELAKKEYLLALEAIQSNPYLGGVTGRMFQQNNLLDYAIEAYSKTMDLDQNANFKFQMAEIYGEKGNFEKMFDMYMELVDSNENYIGNIQRYMGKYITNNPLNNNNIALKKSLLRKSVRNPKRVWNQLLSWLFIKQKEYEKAYLQERALFKREPSDITPVFKLAEIAYEDQAYVTAKKCFDYLLNNGSALDEKLKAELYLLKIAIKTTAKNNLYLFEKVLKKYGTNKHTLAIQMEYAAYLIFKKNRPLQGIEILENALSLSDDKFKNGQIKLKLGEAFVFLGSFNRALRYFSQVQTQLKNHPLSQQARFKVAQTSYFKGDFRWAKIQLKVLKGSTSQLIANDAAKLFLTISEHEPRDSIPSGLSEFASAELLVYQNKTYKALSIYDTILKKYRGFPIEDEALFNQASLYLKENYYDQAIGNLLKIISLDSRGILIDDTYYKLAEIYKNNIKDFKKASEYYQKIIFEETSSIHLVEARKKYRELRGDVLN